jgi:M-phase inducer tyrosine phosphatase
MFTFGPPNPIPTPELLPDDDCRPSRIPRALPLRDPNPFPTINPSELRLLIADFHSLGYDLVLIVDARFEYEYHGGHIRGSKNIRSFADMKDFYDDFRGCNACVIFHCEFSRHRGPTLMRGFRDHDRRTNLTHYPKLDFPDVRLLEGGYSRFHNECPDLCDGGYVAMQDRAFELSGELKRSHSRYEREMDRSPSTPRVRRAPSQPETTWPLTIEGFLIGTPLTPIL